MFNRIVVHFVGGRLERGYTTDFQPGKEVFHLIVTDGQGKARSILIRMDELKAVFFVKELLGKKRPRPVPKKTFAEFKDKTLIGKKVTVEFKDGEVLHGLTLGYSPLRKGFFFTLLDPESNNERIFAVMSAVKNITFHD